MADEQRPQRDLIVRSCVELRRGKAKSGREWVLYKVLATTQDGTPVETELRSFTKLEALEAPQRFEVEVGEYQGTQQFTLHPVRVAKLPERVETLERRLLELEERFARLESAGVESSPDAGESW